MCKIKGHASMNLITKEHLESTAKQLTNELINVREFLGIGIKEDSLVIYLYQKVPWLTIEKYSDIPVQIDVIGKDKL